MYFTACLSSQCFTSSKAENTAALRGASKQHGKGVEKDPHPQLPSWTQLSTASEQSQVWHCPVLPSLYLIKPGQNIPGKSSLQKRGWSSHCNKKGFESRDGSHHPSAWDRRNTSMQISTPSAFRNTAGKQYLRTNIPQMFFRHIPPVRIFPKSAFSKAIIQTHEKGPGTSRICFPSYPYRKPPLAQAA